MNKDKVSCKYQLSDVEIEIFGNGAIVCDVCGERKLKGIQCQVYEFVPTVFI